MTHPRGASPEGGGGRDLGQPGVIPLRPLEVGEILEGAVRVIRVQPALMLGSCAIVVAISQTISVLATLAMGGRTVAVPIEPNLTQEQALDRLGDLFVETGPSLIVAVLGQTFLSGFLIVVVGKAVLGTHVGFRQVWQEARPRLPPLLRLTVVYGVLVFAGLVLFVLPGIWLYVVFGLATPALVLERGGIGVSMSRSRLLVRDSWWRVFGVLALAFLVSVLLSAVVQAPVNAGAPAAPTAGTLWLSALGGTIAGTVSYPFIAAVTALVYVDQRMRKEGMATTLARSAAMNRDES